MASIVPFLWFDSNAEEAVNFYVSVFPNSRVDRISRYGPGAPLPEGTPMTVEFVLEGQEYMALNGGPSGAAPAQPYSGAIALLVSCDTQAQLDKMWDTLLEGGAVMGCGWLRDKYGFVWNLVPAGMGELLGGDDDRSQRARAAMRTMEKLDLNELRRAYDGEPVAETADG